jgi:hypothetical protein
MRVRILFFDCFQNEITEAGVTIRDRFAKHAHQVVKLKCILKALHDMPSVSMATRPNLNEKINWGLYDVFLENCKNVVAFPLETLEQRVAAIDFLFGQNVMEQRLVVPLDTMLDEALDSHVRPLMTVQKVSNDVFVARNRGHIECRPIEAPYEAVSGVLELGKDARILRQA